MAKYFSLDLVPQLGGQLGSISVRVVHHGTTSAVSLYADSALTGPIVNPIVMDSYNISFWVADGTVEYDLILTGGNLRRAVTVENIWSLPGPVWADISTFWADVTAEWAWISPYHVTVKTVQNVGQLYTGNDLIRAAMRLIQVAAVDTDLTASELRDGLESLNRMIDAWALEELMLYQVTRETFPLAASQLSYSVGLGGDFDTVRPTKLVGAYLTISTGAIPVDYPMQVIGYDDYNDIRLKTLQTNFPSYCYYEPAFPLANLYVYPVCAVNNESITLTSWKPLAMIADPTATISLPPGYWEALVFNLAVRIAEEYQFDMRPTTIAIAESSLKKIKRMNQRTLTLQTDVALMNTSQMRYSIYADGYGR